jgi:hypothetical protein
MCKLVNIHRIMACVRKDTNAHPHRKMFDIITGMVYFLEILN